MNKKIVALLSGLLAIILLMGYAQATAVAQPGDFNDPLVTKRYVDDKIANVIALIGQAQPGGVVTVPSSEPVSPADRDTIVSEMMVYFENVYGEALRQSGGGNWGSQPGSGAAQVPYEAVFAASGRTIIGLSGTEIILRGGSAVAVSGINGLCNVTIGDDVVDGMPITLNHLHIVPGSDGRGMRFSEDSYLMIKGEFYFVD